jgi:hypothetical protein
MLLNNLIICSFIDVLSLSRFFFSRIKDYLQIAMTFRVEDFLFARRLSRVFCEVSFKIEEFVTMH